MGLDSVELIMKVEKYFEIRIPDVEAEKIYTIQHMVEAIARQLNIESEDMQLRDKIFSNVSSCLRIITKTDKKLLLTDKIANYLSAGDKEKWNEFENLLKLEIPRPDSYNPYINKLSDKLRKLISWTPNYNWQEVSLEHFVDAVCAANYQILLNANSIKSKYEIYIGVISITVDKIGVDYFEISPEKSFTSDLGID